MANSTVLVPSGWSPRQYILAAMAGTLVASTVIVVASVILSPAQIHFSVTNATSSPSRNGKGVVLNFTLAADNPSRRVGVQYRDVMIDLMLYTTRLRTESILARVVNATVPFYQPPMSSTSMGASGFLEKGFSRQNFGASQGGKGNGSAPPMSVVVIAEVRFKVGVAYSRPYDVRVSCPSVDFFTGAGSENVPRLSQWQIGLPTNLGFINVSSWCS